MYRLSTLLSRIVWPLFRFSFLLALLPNAERNIHVLMEMDPRASSIELCLQVFSIRLDCATLLFSHLRIAPVSNIVIFWHMQDIPQKAQAIPPLYYQLTSLPYHFHCSTLSK